MLPPLRLTSAHKLVVGLPLSARPAERYSALQSTMCLAKAQRLRSRGGRDMDTGRQAAIHAIALV